MVPKSLHGHPISAFAFGMIVDGQTKSVRRSLRRGFTWVLDQVSDLLLAVYGLAHCIRIPPAIDPDVRPPFPLFELQTSLLIRCALKQKTSLFKRHRSPAVSIAQRRQVFDVVSPRHLRYSAGYLFEPTIQRRCAKTPEFADVDRLNLSVPG